METILLKHYTEEEIKKVYLKYVKEDYLRHVKEDES